MFDLEEATSNPIQHRVQLLNSIKKPIAVKQRNTKANKDISYGIPLIIKSNSFKAEPIHKVLQPPYDKYDYDKQAERESSAIRRSNKIKHSLFGTRLKKYYYHDGHKFNTGEKHRLIGRNA